MIDKQAENNKLAQQQAYDKAVRFLSVREHSEVELRKKLSGFSSSIVDSILYQLQQQGYQSDERFVEIAIRSRIMHGKGYRFIKQELAQHKISNELIEKALDGIDGEQWQDYCYQAWKKKFARRDDALGFVEEKSQSEIVGEEEGVRENDYQETIKQRIKQQNFLSQRGFRPQDWQGFLK